MWHYCSVRADLGSDNTTLPLYLPNADATTVGAVLQRNGKAWTTDDTSAFLSDYKIGIRLQYLFHVQPSLRDPCLGWALSTSGRIRI